MRAVCFCFTFEADRKTVSFSHPLHLESYPLSLHDALPIYSTDGPFPACMSNTNVVRLGIIKKQRSEEHTSELQSVSISYAVFCLKKKTGMELCVYHHR